VSIFILFIYLRFVSLNLNLRRRYFKWLFFSFFSPIFLLSLFFVFVLWIVSLMMVISFQYFAASG